MHRHTHTSTCETWRKCDAWEGGKNFGALFASRVCFLAVNRIQVSYRTSLKQLISPPSEIALVLLEGLIISSLSSERLGTDPELTRLDARSIEPMLSVKK